MESKNQLTFEMSDLVDVMQSIIDRIPREITVTSINGIRAFTCNTLYVSECKLVEDSMGNIYEVSSFLENEWIDLKPYKNAPAFNDTVIIATQILFLHGTPISTNNEYLEIESRTRKKTPFIWLLESYTENVVGLESSLEAVYENIRLFFMEGAIEDKNNNEQHILYINPMNRLAELFRQVVENDFSFKRPTDTRIIPRARFGVEITDRGNVRHILNDGLSGAEMIITLEMYDIELCKTNC